MRRVAPLVLLAFVISMISWAEPGKQGVEVGFDDGAADGKKSLGGNGEMVLFSLPPAEGGNKLQGIRIHGSRYGLPDPPDEDFLIYILSEDLSEVIHTETAPYSLFERGAETWVNVTFKKVRAVPQTFWIVLDFRAGRTKGVYLSFDTSNGGVHSKVGLPGRKASSVDTGGDWMIRAVMQE